MAKNTRKLNIVVSVRDQTKKALGGIRANIRRFSEATSKAIGRAFKVGLASAAVAFGVFTANVKRQFDEIDQLAKDAFRFGVAIENIRGLELAGKLAGLSLSEMTTILRDTSRRVSEAAQGTGEAQDAIKELGLNAKQLNMLPVERQLDMITKALGDVENKNDRVRLAYDIMGRSGVKGLTLIGTSIQGSIQQTELLGTALNNDITGNVQDANDELARMKEAFKGIVQVAVAELAPKLTTLFGWTKQQLIDVRGGIKAIPLTIESELIRVRTALDRLEADMLSSKVGRFLLGEGAEGAARHRQSLGEDRLAAIQEQIDALTRQAGDLTSEVDRPNFFDGQDEGGQGMGSNRPTAMPSIVGGNLLTGAAQSGAERIAAIAKEADQRRRKEAAEAKRQREVHNDLLRSLVANQGQTQLGSLLQ